MQKLIERLEAIVNGEPWKVRDELKKVIEILKERQKEKETQ